MTWVKKYRRVNIRRYGHPRHSREKSSRTDVSEQPTHLIRDFFRDLIIQVFPILLAGALGLALIQVTFEKQRKAEEAKISIEYAVITNDYRIISDSIKAAITAITSSRPYRSYQTRNFGRNDVALLTSGGQLSSGMVDKVSVALGLYEAYLNEASEKLLGDIEALPTLPAEKVRLAGFEHLDSIASLSVDETRKMLHTRYIQDKQALTNALVSVRALKTELDATKSINRIKLTLLNKGATDGLVRHRGEIEYPGTGPVEKRNRYKMARTAPPTSDAAMVAVPVFQINKEDDLSSKSVGKVEKDSMTEFWYEIAATSFSDDRLNICDEQKEKFLVKLWDQNRAEVSRLLACYEEEE